ncbi:MAG: hypothetical protein WBW49_12380 [Candidatus Acidiferrum sp.]
MAQRRAQVMRASRQESEQPRASRRAYSVQVQLLAHELREFATAQVQKASPPLERAQPQGAPPAFPSAQEAESSLVPAPQPVQLLPVLVCLAVSGGPCLRHLPVSNLSASSFRLRRTPATGR